MKPPVLHRLAPLRRTPRHGRSRGFTLTELLVVIGLLAAMLAILYPVLITIIRQGRVTRVQASMLSISTALEAYRQDFGDYPRFELDDANFPNPLNSAPDRGARLLARALFGPAPANDPAIEHDISQYSGNMTARTRAYLNASKTAFQDGHGDAEDPLGFKPNRQVIARGTSAGVHFPGDVKGPYLDPDRFDLRRTTDPDLLSAGYIYGPEVVILDPAWGHPILYFPARSSQPDLTVPGNFLDYTGPLARPTSLYNGFDNRGYPEGTAPAAGEALYEGLSMFRPAAVTDTSRLYLAQLLGDLDQDGAIGPGETAAHTGPFLLISGGPNGFQLDGDAAEGVNFGTWTWWVSDPIANFPISR